MGGAAALLVVVGRANAFVSVSPRQHHHATRPSLPLYSSSPISGEDRELLQKQLQESAQQMKNMTPEQMEAMIAEMDNMPAFQKQQLESMGMNVEVMKQTMKMLKDNPEQIQNMGKMMETMTPEELVEQSKVAQENLKNLAALQQEENAAAGVKDADIVEEDEEEEEEEEDEDEDEEPIVADPKVLDSMYQVAEYMSETPEEGGVTFLGFQTVPPIAILLAGTGEDDLTKQELTECWNKGSLGATRVDRSGFERVWNEVQDQYYNDIVEEARERTLVKKQKRGSEKPATTPLSPTTPVVGAGMTPEQLSEQVKNMSEDDLSTMFDQMNNMTKEDEERMKAMGVDPAMMKKSAEMMKSNPLLRKAATTMMKMTPPDQLMKASQEAQERMANMSEEEKKRMMDSLK